MEKQEKEIWRNEQVAHAIKKAMSDKEWYIINS
jgi:hypothetical protein